MTLHSLHYAIQRAFGWRSTHLHDFHLPRQVFERVAANSLSGWLDACGLYFDCPREGIENDHRYWDYDCGEDEDIQAWLKAAYTGPYAPVDMKESLMEEQSDARPLVQAFRKRKGENASLWDFVCDADQNPQDLIEGARVAVILFPRGEKAKWRRVSQLRKTVPECYDFFAEYYEEIKKRMQDMPKRKETGKNWGQRRTTSICFHPLSRARSWVRLLWTRFR